MSRVRAVPNGPDREAGNLSVRVEVVVVDGSAAAAWKARQTAAIRALLEWMAEQPPHGEPGSGQIRDSGRRAA